jgi:hypothetical protein
LPEIVVSDLRVRLGRRNRALKSLPPVHVTAASTRSTTVVLKIIAAVLTTERRNQIQFSTDSPGMSPAKLGRQSRAWLAGGAISRSTSLLTMPRFRSDALRSEKSRVMSAVTGKIVTFASSLSTALRFSALRFEHLAP